MSSRRNHMGVIAVPTIDTPEAVTEVSKRLRAYVLERRTLGEQSATAASDRRRAALGLLVDETRGELIGAITDNAETWRTALDPRAEQATTAYAQAIATLDTTRTAVGETLNVVAWLRSTVTTGLRAYVNAGPARLDGDRTWLQLMAVLAADVGVPVAATEYPDPAPRQIVPESIRHAVATLPTLDVPNRIAEVYATHRQLIDQHRNLGAQRRQADQTRRDAQLADRRALADAIRDGKADPGDINTEALNATLDNLDTTRARLAIDIADTHRDVAKLINEHRDQWLAVVTERCGREVYAYAQAVTDLTTTREAHHHARQALEWLDTLGPDDVGHWHHRPQPLLDGEQWEATAQQLKRDVSALRSALDEAGQDAA